MKPQWNKLNLDRIQLSGIHHDLLKNQAHGLSGHIGEVFPDLSERSAWLGGDGEAWERGPYYIDGLIPLAYLVKDDVLINQANRWMDSIINSQEESGFFGPKQTVDWWPRAVVLKAMVSAYHATERKDILQFIKRYLEYMMEHIEESPFDFWGYARGMEGKEALDLLQEQGILSDLSNIEQKWTENTLDWTAFFLHFPYDKPTHYYLNKHFFRFLKPFLIFFDSLAKKRKKPKKVNRYKILAQRLSKSNALYLTTHGVNIAMSFKYLLYWNNDSTTMFSALDTVRKYHGNALDLFSSDEHLNGTNPDTGIELCTVVEMMYSMEEAMRMTGSMRAADQLEIYAYNALLATITEDFSGHQYVQQVNQSDCEVKHHPFYDTDKYANTFGVAPNFGCCAANMHQGWPKMMLSAVMKSTDQLVIFLYVNGTYRVDFEDGHISFEVETTYPFSDDIMIRCLESTVTKNKNWLFRIPYMTDTVLINHSNEIKITGINQYEMKGLSQGEEIQLHFEFKIQTLTNPDESISVRRGPLVFALPIESKEFYIKGEKPFYDRGYSPKEYPEISLMTDQGHVKVIAFNQVIEEKTFFKNQTIMKVSGYNNQKSCIEEIKLIPYGKTILRKTQFEKKDMA